MERAVAQVVVSSLVVLWFGYVSGIRVIVWELGSYSFAKTPLKDAQAPLAMARASHAVRPLKTFIVSVGVVGEFPRCGQRTIVVRHAAGGSSGRAVWPEEWSWSCKHSLA